MTDQSATDDAKLPSPTATAHLWWLSMMIIAGLLAIAASGKWKPVGWFPAALGVAVGVLAVTIPHLLRTASGRAWHAALIAAISMAVTLWVTAQWHMPAEVVHSNPMAEALLKSFPSVEGEPVVPAPRSRWSRYLERRYATQKIAYQAVWVAAELTIAAAACAVTVWLVRVRFALKPEPTP